MKKLFCILAIAFAVIGARAQNVALLPANKPWSALWDNPNPPAFLLTCELFYGTNKVATLTTNDYSILGVTNSVQTMTAVLPGVPEGTNIVTMVFLDQFGRESPTSPPLTLTVLGFPSAPQNPRKR